MVKLGEAIMILELHRQGLTVSAIARQAGLDRKTVRKYIDAGVQAPRYGPRAPRVRVIDRFTDYVTQRVQQYPGLSIERLLREIRNMGYPGGRTALGDLVRLVRPRQERHFEVRFETPAGRQAQVDFAHFETVFEDQPQQVRRVWLFSIVLGHSRYLWGRFVEHPDLQTLLRCHMEAFVHLGGVPGEILYDRMKTAVLGGIVAHKRKRVAIFCNAQRLVPVGLFAGVAVWRQIPGVPTRETGDLAQARGVTGCRRSCAAS